PEAALRCCAVLLRARGGPGRSRPGAGRRRPTRPRKGGRARISIEPDFRLVKSGKRPLHPDRITRGARSAEMTRFLLAHARVGAAVDTVFLDEPPEAAPLLAAALRRQRDVA